MYKYDIRKDIVVGVKSYYNYVLIVSKCICENKNGGGNRDHWLCEEDGLFSRSGRCNANEWCIGPYIKINISRNLTSPNINPIHLL